MRLAAHRLLAFVAFRATQQAHNIGPFSKTSSSARVQKPLRPAPKPRNSFTLSSPAAGSASRIDTSAVTPPSSPYLFTYGLRV